MKYKIPFIRPCYQRFYAKNKKALDLAFRNCMERGDLTLRSDVWKLEKDIAKFVGTKYAVGVNSGTDALRIALHALGIGKGDEVITVANTFLATIEAIHWVGATPILIDVNQDEQMNLNELEAAITPRTKAVIPVHYTGMMVDMTRLMAIAKKHKIYVVEDFCQALGAEQNGKKAGSFGVINAVSFNTAKLLGGMCDGGMLTTDDRELYETACLLRNHWNVHQLSVERTDYPQPDKMQWAWKSRLSNVNAAFLNVKFRKIKWMLERRKEIALRYNEAFRDCSVGAPHNQKGRIWQEYHLKVYAEDRMSFAEYLADRGIETLVRDSIPNHKMTGLRLEHFDLPVTERLARQIIRLPLHEWLTDDEVEYIIETVKSFYDNTNKK